MELDTGMVKLLEAQLSPRRCQTPSVALQNDQRAILILLFAQLYSGDLMVSMPWHHLLYWKIRPKSHCRDLHGLKACIIDV